MWNAHTLSHTHSHVFSRCLSFTLQEFLWAIKNIQIAKWSEVKPAATSSASTTITTALTTAITTTRIVITTGETTMKSSLTFPSTVSGPNDLSGLPIHLSLSLSLSRDICTYVFICAKTIDNNKTTASELAGGWCTS